MQFESFCEMSVSPCMLACHVEIHVNDCQRKMLETSQIAQGQCCTQAHYDNSGMCLIFTHLLFISSMPSCLMHVFSTLWVPRFHLRLSLCLPCHLFICACPVRPMLLTVAYVLSDFLHAHVFYGLVHALNPSYDGYA